MFLRCDVAEHGGSCGSDHGSPDGACDVVVPGRDVGDKRSQCVERCGVTELLFGLGIFFHALQRNMARAFDNDLNVTFLRSPAEFAQGRKFSHLGAVAGIVNAARS